MNQEEQQNTNQSTLSIIKNAEQIVINCDGQEIDGMFLKDLVLPIEKLTETAEVVESTPNLAWIFKVELPNEEPIQNHPVLHNLVNLEKLIADRIISNGPIPVSKYSRAYMSRLNTEIIGFVDDVTVIDNSLRLNVSYIGAEVNTYTQTKYMQMVLKLNAVQSMTSAGYDFYVSGIQLDEQASEQFKNKSN